MKLTLEPSVQFVDALDQFNRHLGDSRLAAEEVQHEVARAGRRVEIALLVVAFGVFLLALSLKANVEAARCPTS